MNFYSHQAACDDAHLNTRPCIRSDQTSASRFHHGPGCGESCAKPARHPCRLPKSSELRLTAPRAPLTAGLGCARDVKARGRVGWSVADGKVPMGWQPRLLGAWEMHAGAWGGAAAAMPRPFGCPFRDGDILVSVIGTWKPGRRQNHTYLQCNTGASLAASGRFRSRFDILPSLRGTFVYRYMYCSSQAFPSPYSWPDSYLVNVIPFISPRRPSPHNPPPLGVLEVELNWLPQQNSTTLTRTPASHQNHPPWPPQ